jgi:ketosteroid isomerase-like protein
MHMSEQENRRVVEQLWEAMDRFDFEAAGDLLHEDYIGEWPQSRERIRGRANFVAVNANYPGRWRIAIQRLVASGNQVATEVTLTCDGRTERAVSFFELRDGKIVRETDYWPEPYDAPTWRAQWVEQMG